MLEKITKVETDKNVCDDFVLLSDIHASKSTDYNWLYKAAKKIKDRGVSAVLVLGDSLNDGLDIESAKRLSDVFYEFAKSATVIMINGNHDLVTPKQTENGKRWFFIHKPEDLEKFREVLKLFEDIPNVNLLRNNSVVLPFGIRVVGFEIGPSYYTNEIKNTEMLENHLETYFNFLLDPNEYNIFLSHSPLNFMDPKFRERFPFFNNVDLQLSGHMHNGLLPEFMSWMVPGNRGLIGKKNGKPILFPELSKGRVNFDENSCGIIASPYCTISEEKLNKINYNLLYPPVLQTVKVRKRKR